MLHKNHLPFMVLSRLHLILGMLCLICWVRHNCGCSRTLGGQMARLRHSDRSWTMLKRRFYLNGIMLDGTTEQQETL